jgi:hypothetical protein
MADESVRCFLKVDCQRCKTSFVVGFRLTIELLARLKAHPNGNSIIISCPFCRTQIPVDLQILFTSELKARASRAAEAGSPITQDEVNAFTILLQAGREVDNA